ncbi:hypothetical protein ABIB50_003158 [Mucilaginibacter sp. UYCu711]
MISANINFWKMQLYEQPQCQGIVKIRPVEKTFRSRRCERQTQKSVVLIEAAPILLG